MLLIIDLEATCADDGSISPEAMEIIEIGACWMAPSGEVIDRFQSFVRPLERPTLTAFCRQLTYIEQHQVDTAPTFPAAATALQAFAMQHAAAGASWGSWGAYDRKQIARECARHRVPDPLAGLVHRNLKREFAKAKKIKEVGMAGALRILGLEIEGNHHRALDDALNIARIQVAVGR